MGLYTFEERLLMDILEQLRTQNVLILDGFKAILKELKTSKRGLANK